MGGDDTAPPRRRVSRPVAFALATGLLLAVLAVAGFAWLRSGHAVHLVLDRAVAAGGGRLALEDVSGSLAGVLRIGRVAWRDGGTEIVAEGVVLDFAPAALLHGTVRMREATARHVAVRLQPSDAPVPAPPASIGLPVGVRVDRLAVDAIDWRHGETRGTLHGLALVYAGDGDAHRVDDLQVRAEGAALAGQGRVGAARPFPLEAGAIVDLAAPHPAGRVEAKAKGSLDALRVELRSSLAGVEAQASVDLRPLDAQPVAGGRLEARAVDLAVLDSAWPATQIDLLVDAKPVPGGFAGTLEARNALAGPLDRNRVPLASATAAFTLQGRMLGLDRLAAEVPGGGTLRGDGSVALDGGRNRWTLAVAGLDLAQLHGRLRTTRLAGRVEADVDGGVQRVRGDVAQDDLALAFDARHDGREVVAERFVARARGGSLAGAGRVALAGARAFLVEARAERFDPSRFGAFPAGAIDGTARAQGTLGGTPAAQADLVIAQGSTLAGLPFAGRVRGRFTPASAEALEAGLSLGSTRLTAQGAVNRGDAPLVVTLASTRLAELAPLWPNALPALSGALDARVRLAPRARGATVSFEARAEQLRVGDAWAFATLRAQGRARHDAPLRTPRLAALAEVGLDAAATGLVSPQGSLDRAQATLAGSPAEHTLGFSATQGTLTVEGRAAGALDLAEVPRWRGRVLALRADGVPDAPRIALAAPADLEVARERVVLGAARLGGGGAEVSVDALAWDRGRLTTRGRYTGVPLAPLARRAGLDGRWPTDLVLGGTWDVAAAPQWRGSVTVARERGDVYVDAPAGEGAGRAALGVSTLRLEAALDGPRLTAQGEVRARLAGNTLLSAVLTADEARLHPFDPAARLGGTVRAHVPSLATLQPWVGTVGRVQGQAIAEVNLGGTLGEPAFTGQLVGYGLGLDMPQAGIHLADGTLRLVSGPEGLRLEAFEVAGGAGRFSATGTIALPGAAAGAATRIAWRAQDFRALNHPDRRLVVDGEGTLASVDGRWRLAGRLAIDEATIAYRSTADTVLADDIVVVGRPRTARAPPAAAQAKTPVDVDLAVEFGRDFRVSAEGLESRLAGRVDLVSRRGEPLTAKGTVRAVQGTYYVFGQKLAIDRGRIVFDGPVDNPTLDVVALRRNLAVEAGVEISGTVRAPVVRLTSNPPVPDSEKLSWLLTGGPPGSATQREALALQAAQAALAGRSGKPLAQQFAQNLGLDDIGLVRRGDGAGDDLLAGQVVTVGKRITDRLYVAYEQGLELATNALRVEYVLSRFLTVSAYAGTTSGVELKFRRTWR